MTLSRRARIWLAISFTFSYFLVEIVVGYVTSSISLIADSFHMISDVIALFIALYAIHLSSKKCDSPSKTYGWARAKILGALVNGVFLLALCFSLLIQSIQRFIKVEEIENPILILIVGGVGLLFNLVGMFFFHDHGHGHSHHHHHDHHNHKHESSHNNTEKSLEDGSRKQPHQHSETRGLNMRGVFLHFLGDALGSVGVLISALLNLYLPSSEHPWTVYVDPIASLFITLILVSTATPLVKSTLSILLQSAPDNVDVSHLRDEILKIGKVVSIHDFHVCKLAEGKTIASVHVEVLCQKQVGTRDSVGEEEAVALLNDFGSELQEVVENIQALLHSKGVHNVTVQTETQRHGANNYEASTVVSQSGTEGTSVCPSKCTSNDCKPSACC